LKTMACSSSTCNMVFDDLLSASFKEIFLEE
jgi:hypothetical protein